MTVHALKLCPFCGNTEPDLPQKLIKRGRATWFVTCRNFCVSIYGSTAKNAVTNWNCRYQENKLPPADTLAKIFGRAADELEAAQPLAYPEMNGNTWIIVKQCRELGEACLTANVQVKS